MLTDLTTSKFFKTEQIETAASVTNTAVSVTDAVFFVTQTAVSVTQTAVDRMRVRYDEQRAGCQRATRSGLGRTALGRKSPVPCGQGFPSSRVGLVGGEGKGKRRRARYEGHGDSQPDSPPPVHHRVHGEHGIGGRVPLRFRRACKCRELALRPELLTDYHLEVTL